MHEPSIALTMPNHTVILEEGQRQATLLALAHLAVERPGWNHLLTEIAAMMDNMKPDGDLQMFTLFKQTCDRKAEAERTATPLAAGFCRGLATGERFPFEPHELAILKHAAKILAKVAGVSFDLDEEIKP